MFAADLTKHHTNMWLALPVVVLIVLGIIGALVVSFYAAVLVPIAVIVLLVGMFAIGRRASDPEFRERLNEKQSPPLGGTGGVVDDQASAPKTPDEILEARRQAH